MRDFNKLNTQMKFMNNLMNEIHTKIVPKDETLQVFNESIMENDLVKWWSHLDNIEKKKIETREKFFTEFFDL